MKLKYIMTKDRGVVIFTELLAHDEVASKFGGATSAGFININNFCGGKVECYGKSISLRLEPAEDDEEEINRQLGND